MWASMFREPTNNAARIVRDIITLIRDCLKALNECYNSQILETLIRIIPDFSEQNRDEFSPLHAAFNMA